VFETCETLTVFDLGVFELVVTEGSVGRSVEYSSRLLCGHCIYCQGEVLARCRLNLPKGILALMYPVTIAETHNSKGYTAGVLPSDFQILKRFKNLKDA
jgi:hypothetical protein